MLDITVTMQLVSRHTHMGTTLCDTRLYNKVENNMDLQCFLCNCFVVWCVSAWIKGTLSLCVWHEEQFYIVSPVPRNGEGGLADHAIRSEWVHLTNSCNLPYFWTLYKNTF